MTSEEEAIVYDGRASEHTSSAEQADDAAVKAWHYELAARYSALAALGRKMTLEAIYARRDGGE